MLSVNFGAKMPTGQEFRLEYNVGKFASEHADSIFRGKKKKGKLFGKKKLA